MALQSCKKVDFGTDSVKRKVGLMKPGLFLLTGGCEVLEILK